MSKWRSVKVGRYWQVENDKVLLATRYASKRSANTAAHEHNDFTRAGEQNGAAPQDNKARDRGFDTGISAPSSGSLPNTPGSAAAAPPDVGEMVKSLAALIPTSWLDPLLTGPSAVLSKENARYTDQEIENLLLALKERVRNCATALLSQSQPKPEPGGDSRAQFEKWISAPPFERGTLRLGPDDTSWPGGYVEYYTQVAWDAWQAARLLSSQNVGAGEVVVKRNVLQVISDEFHRLELAGVDLTERADYAWQELTAAMLAEGKS